MAAISYESKRTHFLFSLRLLSLVGIFLYIYIQINLLFIDQLEHMQCFTHRSSALITTFIMKCLRIEQ